MSHYPGIPKPYRGKTCSSGDDNKNCRSGVCAYPGSKHDYNDNDIPDECCPMGSGYDLHGFYHYCTNLPVGSYCDRNAMCKNGMCAWPGDYKNTKNKICCPNGTYEDKNSGETMCKDLDDGNKCLSKEGCKWGDCTNGTCGTKGGLMKKKTLMYALIIGGSLLVLIILIIIFAVVIHKSHKNKLAQQEMMYR